MKEAVWDEVKRIPSSNENVWKYVFSKPDAVAEAVLYRYPTFEKRTVICCSTQSGCPVGCRFCGAGDHFVRSLTADEIVAQPGRLMEDTGVRCLQMERLQIMFMSMGEPLLNLKNLAPAIRRLHTFYPNAALLVSTIGPDIPQSQWAEFHELAKDVPTVGLQFSVHESTDEKRDALIPFDAKLNLSRIAMEGYIFHSETGRKPFFNYCAHSENTTTEDAQRLRELFPPLIWNATISVICERDEHVAAANSRQRQLALNFERMLSERGYNTRTFDPAGQDDIGGGCGQLWYVQDWMRINSHLARPSCGDGLPVIHTPV